MTGRSPLAPGAHATNARSERAERKRTAIPSGSFHVREGHIPRIGVPVAEHDQSSLLRARRTATLTRIIRARTRRSALFSAELVADPAWDILLELSLARLEGRTVSIAELVRLSPVGENIVLRWVDKLAQDGWIRAEVDASDARGAQLDLSEKAADAMQKWISEFEGGSGWPGDDRITSLLERIDRGRRDL